MYIGEICRSAMLKAVSIAGIEEQGVPFKKESIELEEAARIVSIGNLTWIECVVDDIVKESPCLLYTSPSPRDRSVSRMPSSA